MNRPAPTEFADFYTGYVGGVPDGEILTLLQSELDRTSSLLRALKPEQASHRYREGKWSVKEVVGHIIDAERMFGYRAHCFARQDPAHLPSFDQMDYARSSNADDRPLADLVDELNAVVDAKSVAAAQPSNASREGQSGNTCVRDQPARCR